MPENLNLQSVETVDTSPFRKLVMTIGELPTAFVESMTYYELLAWFTNYLETVIIPTVNNNAECVEELQNKYVILKNETEAEIARFENATDAEIAEFEASTDNKIETFSTYITNQFNTLQNFVDNYFDNLDVQEEINNKLDAMADAGTLQTIIYEYLNSVALFTYDTVADMKLATNFVNGSYAKTLGYSSRTDRGGAVYKIRTKTINETANEMTLIALSDNTLIAELVLTTSMNVRQFGAKGDGTTDDTTAIQTALNTCASIIVPSGTYMIDATSHLNMNSKNKLTLDNDATLKAITTDVDSYRVISIDNVTDVEISGGTIEGDRLTHTGTEGEWGHCIRMSGTSDRIYIHDINLINAWGDGLSCVVTGDIRTERVHVDNARRNGFSVVGANSFASYDDFIENTNGTNPQAGIDIEPDTGTSVFKNVHIENLRTKNNAGTGLSIYYMKGITDPININVVNMQDYASKNGINIEKDTASTGIINIEKPYLWETKDAAIRLWRCYDSGCTVRINCPQIINCNTSDQGTQYGAGITGYVLGTDDDYPLGNIEIIEPYITNHNTSINTAINLIHSGSSDPAINNLKIINPYYMQGTHHITVKNASNFVFTDLYKTAIKTLNSSATLTANQYYSNYVGSASASANITLTVPDTGIPIGYKIKITNMNATRTMSVKLPTTDYCNQLTASVSPRIIMPKMGDSMEIEKVTSTEWVVNNINCTPTIV